MPSKQFLSRDDCGKLKRTMFKLPPLNPLRAFEVAARHSSIKLAAEELNVTPGAVSRHVQYLEDYLRIRLFERRNRELELTSDGRTYLGALTDAFGRIDEATRQLTDRNRRERLHIWSSVTFTMRWLVPRLPSFHFDNPGLDVAFTTSLAPLDFTADKVDVAIRNRPIEGDGLTSLLLFETDLLLVCSPEFLAASGPIAEARDIVRHTRIHSAARSDDWAKWLRFAGIEGVSASAGITFESSSLGYRAAQDGLGIALAQRALIADDLAKGRLVVALDLPLKGEARFYLTFRRDNKRAEHREQFQAWILDQAARSDQPI
jgi:LysR family glycine cleavage system transcriptional activator